MTNTNTNATPNTNATAADREEWLGRALGIFEADVAFPLLGATLPKVRVSCGWPRGSRGKRPGYAYPATLSEDGAVEVFVSPEIGDSRVALAVLWGLAVDVLRGAKPSAAEREHDCRALGGGFARMLDLNDGASGRVAALEADPRFCDALAALGTYPHAAFAAAYTPSATRLLKLEHVPCGWVVRLSAKQAQRMEPGAACPVCDKAAGWHLNGQPIS